MITSYIYLERERTLLLLLLLFGFSTKHLAMKAPISFSTVATSPASFQIDWHRPKKEKKISNKFRYKTQKDKTRFKNRRGEIQKAGQVESIT